MAEEIKTQITQVSVDTEAGIKRNTAEVLPDNPTAAGMKAADIKAAFFKGLTNGDMSLLSELKRVIEEANCIFEKETTAIDSIEQAVEGKLDRQSGNKSYRTVYAEGTDGNVEMIQVRSTVLKEAIVAYGEDNHFTVPSPQKGGHPVNKVYFDNKSNNSLYTEVTDMEKRMKALEHAANGNIYSTVTLSGSASAVQVDNACPYGILSKIGGRVTKITVGMVFDTEGTLAHTSGVSVTENISSNSVSIPVGEKNNIKIPCSISAPCTVKVYATERNTAYLNKGGLMDKDKKQIGDQFTFREGISQIDFTDSNNQGDAKYICITKTAQGAALTEPCYLDELRVTVSDPAKAKILSVIEEIGIPDDILSLDGYGEEGAYLDVTAGKYVFTDGASVSVTLPAEFEVISLLPSALVEFTDKDGNRVAADYELTYKNKL